MDSAIRYQFDAYLMVDWSANNSPKKGKDSIWYCLLEHVDGATRITALENRADIKAEAVSLKNDIERELGIPIRVRAGAPGSFNVLVNGQRVYSKKQDRAFRQPS